MRETHEEVPCPVKAFRDGRLIAASAMVDRGVAPLVQALNELPGVFTTGSCEGYQPPDPQDTPYAWASFQLASTPEEACLFGCRIATIFGSNQEGRSLDAWITIGWNSENPGPPSLELAVPRPAVIRTALFLRWCVSQLSGASSPQAGKPPRASCRE